MNTLKDIEFEKLRFFFTELHKQLELREDQLKKQYIEVFKECSLLLD